MIAWIRVSEDAFVGFKQKGDVFYKALAEYHATIQLLTCPKRSAKPVKRRAWKILSECLAFAGCVAKVTKAQPSGTNSKDIICLATEIMNKLKMLSIIKDCGATFRFSSCWQQLMGHLKFDLFPVLYTRTTVKKKKKKLLKKKRKITKEVLAVNERRLWI